MKPVNKDQQVQIHHQRQIQIRSIPSPEELEKYNKVLPVLLLRSIQPLPGF